ncbi:MAG TPA: PAS domain S-box protein, partial [Leptospiraceae bacterium]|nr:PAS domain S-box protein [Leptospiraceae bacterium]
MLKKKINIPNLSFEEMFFNSDAIHLLIDPETSEIICANPAAERFYGWSKAELVGKKIQDINTLSPEEIKNALDQVKNNRQGFFEYKHRTSNSIRDVCVFSNVIDHNGQILLHSLVYDITEQKRKEETIQKQETFLRQVETLAKIGRWEVDILNQKVFWSKGMFDIYELEEKKESLNFDYGLNLVHPDDRDILVNAFHHSLREKIPITMEHRILLKNGKIKTVNETFKTDFDLKGNPIRTIGVLQDITDRIKTEEALRLSETTMKAIFDNSYESFIFISEQKQILFFNKQAQDRTKRTFDVTLQVGDSIYKIVQPDSLNLFNSNFERAWNGERVVYDKHFTINNLIVWYEFQFIPVKNEKRNTIGVVLTARDITEKKKAELDLKISEARFHAIFDQAPLGIALIESKSGKFIQINPKSTEIIGYTEDELLKMDYQRISYPDDLKEDLENMDKLIQGSIQWFTMEKRLIRKDNRVIWTSLTCVPLKLEEDNFTYHIVIITDITERKMANLQLEDFTESLKKLNATKDKFFSIIAHDLRNPFIGILNLIKVILLNIDKTDKFHENKKYIELIQDSSRSAYDLLENLLHWSRAQTNDIDLFPETIYLKKLVLEVVNLFKGNAAAKNINIEIEISDNVFFFGDEYLTSTIIRNILSNALKYTYRNGRINIFCRDFTDRIEILIQDNGIGISEENLNRLFKIDEKFTESGTPPNTCAGVSVL